MNKTAIRTRDLSMNSMTEYGILIAVLLTALVPMNHCIGTRSSSDVIDIPYGGTPINIDGETSSGEWNDANVSLSLPMGAEQFSLVAKEDGGQILFSFSMDPDPEFYLLRLFIDPFNGTGVSSEAFLAEFRPSFVPKEYNWIGGWTQVSPSGWTGIQGTDALEIVIDFDKLSITSGDQKNFSIAIDAISAATYDTLDWPTGFKDSDPSTWGTMTSSGQWDIPNRPPMLWNGTGSPSFGFTGDKFSFEVVFEDPEGDLPSFGNVVIDGTDHDMGPVQDNGFGVLYGYSTQLGPGDHSHHFEFSDGEFSARYPVTGDIDGPKVYVPNSPPVLVSAIPNGTYRLEEGQGTAIHLIDLEEYFSDDRDDGALDFSVIFEEGPDILDTSLDGSFLNVVQKDLDWYGSLIFQVEAADKGIPGLPIDDYRLVTRSNPFTIDVAPVNDVPEIVYLNRKVSNDTMLVEFLGQTGAVEDRPFSIEVRASDADMVLDPLEDLSFSMDGPAITMIRSGSENATFVFTPGDAEVGTSSWNVMVKDNYGAKDAITLVVETQNVNDRPYIVSCVHNEVTYPVESGKIIFRDGLSAIEDEGFVLDIIAHDDDLLGPGDAIFFGLTSPRDDVLVDAETGELTFLPRQEDVGKTSFGVTVSDRLGAMDQVEILIDVENVNDAPSIMGVYSSTGEMKFSEGEEAYIFVEYLDPDLGFDPSERTDVEWRSDPFANLGAGDRINVSGLAPGSYNITVTVTDNKGTKDALTFTVIVDEQHDGAAGKLVRGLAIGAAILIAFLGFGLFSLLSFTFFSRIKEKSILDNLNRKVIYEAIRRNSGIHFMALSEEVGLAKGVLAHHLNVLEKNNFIKSLQYSKYRRFYSYDEKIEYKLTLTTIQQAIIFTVKQDPGITQSGISEKMGKSKMVINYHIKILKDVGLLSLERNGRETNCFPTSAALDLS